MPAAYDVIVVANNMLREFNCPQSALASLSGISGGKLSQYLNGVVRIGGQDELHLRKAVASIRNLVERARPLPIDFRRVQELRESITALENGSLAILVVNDINEQ